MMNCQEFSDWMQHKLDERSELVLDQESKKHLADCRSCQQDWQAWRLIARSMSAAPASSPSVTTTERQVVSRGAWYWVSAAAATLLLLFALTRGLIHPSDAVVVQNMPADSAPTEVPTSADWWQFGGQRWIESTMPTMQFVRDGVEPIGRPFRHAVSILTMSQERTS